MKRKLSELCSAYTFNIAQKNVYAEGKYPVFGASGKVGYRNDYVCDVPYVGIVKDGSVGKTDIYPPFSSLLGTMQYILPNSDIDIDYLKLALDSLNLSQYKTGTVIPHIYFKDYGCAIIDIPEICEQRRIAAKMKRINSLEAILAKLTQILEDLVKSRFIEMFGDPVTNPKNYPEETLPALGYFARGVSKHRPRNASELLGGKYPLIQTGDVASSGLYIGGYSSTYSELGLKQSKLWKSGTLCITIAANIANTSILTFDACFPDSVVGFIANERTNNVFIHYWFSFFRQIIDSQVSGAAQKNINLKTLGELIVISPPIDDQNQFASFVQQVDKSKLVIKKTLKDLEELKNSLMQKYFFD